MPGRRVFCVGRHGQANRDMAAAISTATPSTVITKDEGALRRSTEFIGFLGTTQTSTCWPGGVARCLCGRDAAQAHAEAQGRAERGTLADEGLAVDLVLVGDHGALDIRAQMPAAGLGLVAGHSGPEHDSGDLLPAEHADKLQDTGKTVKPTRVSALLARMRG